MNVLSALILVSAFFFPAALFLRPEYLLAAVGAASVLVATRGRALAVVRVEALLLALLGVLACVSLARQAFVAGTFVGRDVMVVFRYAFYAACLLTGVGVGLRTWRGRSWRAVFVALLGVVGVLTTLQYFNVAGIAEVLAQVYGRPEELDRIGKFSRRASGTLGNPNYWGFVCAFVLLYCCYMALIERRVLWAVGALLMLWTIVLTGSRTGIVAPVIAWIAFSVLIVRTVRIRRMVVVLPLFLAGVAVAMRWLLGGGSYEFAERFDVSNVNTWVLRTEYWAGLGAAIFGSVDGFLVGAGPSKAVTLTWADNMYVLMLRDFGVAGLLVYVWLSVYVIRRLQRIYRAAPHMREATAAILLGWLLLLAFNVTADAWFAVRPASLVIMMYGIVIGSYAGVRRQVPAERRARPMVVFGGEPSWSGTNAPRVGPQVVDQ